MTIRVLVADDHLIVRQGLRAMFLAEPRMELVAEAVRFPPSVGQV